MPRNARAMMLNCRTEHLLLACSRARSAHERIVISLLDTPRVNVVIKRRTCWHERRLLAQLGDERIVEEEKCRPQLMQEEIGTAKIQKAVRAGERRVRGRGEPRSTLFDNAAGSPAISMRRNSEARPRRRRSDQ